jgi:hypothetical protein
VTIVITRIDVDRNMQIFASSKVCVEEKGMPVRRTIRASIRSPMKPIRATKKHPW